MGLRLSDCDSVLSQLTGPQIVFGMNFSGGKVNVSMNKNNRIPVCNRIGSKKSESLVQ